MPGPKSPWSFHSHKTTTREECHRGSPGPVISRGALQARPCPSQDNCGHPSPTFHCRRAVPPLLPRRKPYGLRGKSRSRQSKRQFGELPAGCHCRVPGRRALPQQSFLNDSCLGASPHACQPLGKAKQRSGDRPTDRMVDAWEWVGPEHGVGGSF